MLTLFSIPKAFDGHIGMIQRNAIKSWTLLEPRCEVILMGDDDGTDKVAEEMGVKHIPDIKRNEFGTPMVDHAFQLAESEGKHSLLCYVNADTILMNDLLDGVQRVKETSDWFLMTSQSRGLDVKSPIEFGQGWQSRLHSELAANKHISHITGIDFWVFPKGLMNEMPPLAVGRPSWESWCLYTTRLRRANLIDSTKAVVSVHQTHDYSHHVDGERGIGRGIEAQRNREAVGGKPYFFIIKDRTHVLNGEGLKRARDAWSIWRGLRTTQVLPVTAPFPAKLTLKALNTAINATRDLMVFAKRVGRR